MFVKLGIISLVLIGLFGAAVFVVFCAWIYSIYYRVKRTPRSEMFFCSKHGFIFPKDCIKWLGQEYCPYCFGSNLRKAESDGLKEYMSHRYTGRIQ